MHTDNSSMLDSCGRTGKDSDGLILSGKRVLGPPLKALLGKKMSYEKRRLSLAVLSSNIVVGKRDDRGI